ncbi:MAG: class SAM-dependent methyltransferase [Sphingobacteriaceae bacterium]|nr:class SAM-dependent methyltransferase [Sphingobacteriaceae bacterium]
MANELTDRQFWSNYWESKTDLAFPVPGNYLFHKQLQRIVSTRNVKTAIELGGFPGYYAIYLKKHLGVESTLLDYFVHRGILNNVLSENKLTEQDIQVIETDLFKYNPEKKYDLVLSCGLIEHFFDTKDIISRHVQFLNPGGTLFITLPNFKSVNGWVQKKFDFANYEKHNIDSMNTQLLASIAQELGLKNIKARYFGNFSLWLENKKEKPALTKAFVKTLWYAGKISTKLVPVESKALSPYIILEATL